MPANRRDARGSPSTRPPGRPHRPHPVNQDQLRAAKGTTCRASRGEIRRHTRDQHTSRKSSRTGPRSSVCAVQTADCAMMYDRWPKWVSSGRSSSPTISARQGMPSRAATMRRAPNRRRTDAFLLNGLPGHRSFLYGERVAKYVSCPCRTWFRSGIARVLRAGAHIESTGFSFNAELALRARDAGWCGRRRCRCATAAIRRTLDRPPIPRTSQPLRPGSPAPASGAWLVAGRPAGTGFGRAPPFPPTHVHSARYAGTTKRPTREQRGDVVSVG